MQRRITARIKSAFHFKDSGARRAEIHTDPPRAIASARFSNRRHESVLFKGKLAEFTNQVECITKMSRRNRPQTMSEQPM